VSVTPDVPGTYTVSVSGFTTGTTLVITATSTKAIASVSSVATSVVIGNTASASAIGDGVHFPVVTVNGGSSDTAYVVSSSGVGTLYGTVALFGIAGTNYNNGTSATTGFQVYKAGSISGTTPFSTGDNFTFAITSSVAGTQTITVSPVNGTSTPATITITWSAVAGVSGVKSSAVLGTGSAIATSTPTDDTVVASRTVGTQAANVQVTLQDASGNAVTGQSISASIAGPGLIGLASGTTLAQPATGRSLSVTGSVGLASQYVVSVWPDGTSGVSTITIVAGGLTFTKTVTFYGSTAKLVAANIATINKIGANADSVEVTAVDALGNGVSGATVNASSSNTLVATVTSATTADSTGLAQITVTGVAAGTAVLTFTNPAGTVTTTATIIVGNSTVAMIVLAFDKTSYAAGAPVVLTITATDAAGNPVADNSSVQLFSASGLLASAAFGGAVLSSNGIVGLVNGVKTYKLFAPLTGGPVSISATTYSAAPIAAAYRGTAVTATATVAADTTLAASIQAALDAANAAADAAAEATDAANAATDAANAAADAADSATAAAQDAADQAGQALAAVNTLATSVAVLIAGIKAQLTSVTNLVIKLIKRVAKLPIKK
jgi:hypothetical protein